MAKDGEDPFKFSTPLPLPDLPAGKNGMGQAPVLEPLPVPSMPSSQASAGSPVPSGQASGVSFPEGDGQEREILLALSGIQATIDRIEQSVRSVLS